MKHSSRVTGSHSAVSGLQVLLAIPLGTIGPSSQSRLAVVPASTSGQKYENSGKSVISASQNPTSNKSDEHYYAYHPICLLAFFVTDLRQQMCH